MLRRVTLASRAPGALEKVGQEEAFERADREALVEAVEAVCQEAVEKAPGPIDREPS